MRTHWPAGLLLALSLCWSGCSPAGTDAVAERIVRDSADVQIVEFSSLGRPPARWELAGVADATIGTLDDPAEQQLYRAMDAARLPDGRILVANSGTYELRYFSSDGVYLSSVGTEGDGPGEFRGLSLIDVVHADSIYVWDQRAARISVVDIEGRFGRSLRLTAPGNRGVARFRASFEDGSFLVALSQFSTEVPRDRSVSHMSATLSRYSAQGALLDTVAVIPYEPSYLIEHSGSGGPSFSFFPIPFTPGGTWAIDGMKLHAGTGEAYEVRTYDVTGRVVRILRVQVEAIPVTDALFDSYVAERMSASSGDQEWLKLLDDAYEHMPRPDVVRFFDALMVDAESRLWVRRTPMPNETTHVWDVFDREGSHAAQALIPQGLRIREIGPDYVLALRRDELDVEQVVLYPIHETESI